MKLKKYIFGVITTVLFVEFFKKLFYNKGYKQCMLEEHKKKLLERVSSLEARNKRNRQDEQEYKKATGNTSNFFILLYEKISSIFE